MKNVNFNNPNTWVLISCFFCWLFIGCSKDDDHSMEVKAIAKPFRIISDRTDGDYSSYRFVYDEKDRIQSIAMVIGKRIADSDFDQILNESQITFGYHNDGQLNTIRMEHPEDGLQVRFNWKYDTQGELTGMEVNWPDSSQDYTLEYDPNSRRLDYTAESISSAFPFWVDFDTSGKPTAAAFAGSQRVYTYSDRQGAFKDIELPRALTLFSLYLNIIYDHTIPLQLGQPMVLDSYGLGSQHYRASGFEYDTEDRITGYSLIQELPEGTQNDFLFKIDYLDETITNETRP
ncbi:hypothetical protein [Sediminicola luteus]|uniref:DUF4595 domain-containing protein n=1 Tax=Sediminicola luteus TaxID=319238 RepID=A0A2A4GEM1_9FLAO|nr:hypothetical protein [Sediminicola luteus]PCE66430.1 hypothetical protein B7P33_03805 [Sediminicola luteus]